MIKFILPFCVLFGTLLHAQEWQPLKTTNSCTARSESSLVHITGKLYLLGSRGIRPVDALDLSTNTWTAMQKPPMELHHFQAIAFKNEIWVLGAFTGNYPHEKPVENIYIFNPKKNEWRKGPAIPQARLRGSAGVTVYKNKIYLFGGEIDGHWDGHTAWLDVYDPKKDKWTMLADAPHARDHITIVENNGKIFVTAGRRTSTKTNQVLSLKEPATDVYDIKTNTWITLPESANVPTLRAGASVVIHNNEVIVMGGESDTQVPAHSEIESLNTISNTWTKLPSLKQGRHSSGAVIIKNKIYYIGGAGNRGGGPELNNGEMLELK